jgi:hypothetical protein
MLIPSKIALSEIERLPEPARSQPPRDKKLTLQCYTSCQKLAWNTH